MCLGSFICAIRYKIAVSLISLLEKKNVKRLPTFMLACFDKRHNLNYLPEDVTDASLVNEVLKFLFITAADLVQKRIATGHKAKPKESLKAISTGTSGTESWKHT